MSWLAIACAATPASAPPARYGLHETSTHRQLVERAIVLADAVLFPDLRLRLRSTWRPSGMFPLLYFDGREGSRFEVSFVTDRGFDNGIRYVGADVIPVYLIDGDDLGGVETAFVPDEERCIFVNARTLDGLFGEFYAAGARAAYAENSFDKATVLGLVLLHELGHLQYAPRGDYGPPARLDLDEIGHPSEMITNPEIRADRFASEVIDHALSAGETVSPIGSEGARTLIANRMLRNILVAVNSFEYREDPKGVFSHMPRPELFRQGGYSHLNLYVRLFVMAEQLAPSAEYQADLQWIAHNLTQHQP